MTEIKRLLVLSFMSYTVALLAIVNSWVWGGERERKVACRASRSPVVCNFVGLHSSKDPQGCRFFRPIWKARNLLRASSFTACHRRPWQSLSLSVLRRTTTSETTKVSGRLNCFYLFFLEIKKLDQESSRRILNFEYNLTEFNL